MKQGNKRILMVILMLVLSFGLIACSSADEKAAKDVDKAISQIPSEVTLDDELVIQKARNLYIRLTFTQKDFVKNYEVLKEKEAQLQDLKDAVIAANIVELIDALPEDVTLENKAEVTDVNDQFSALTENQKAKVTNKDELEAKVATIDELQSALNVQTVIDLINELPEVENVTVQDKVEIVSARVAYTKLTKDEKELITNISKLTAVEEKLEELE